MLGVGGLSLSLGSTGEGEGGGRGGGHLSSRILLVDRPFFPRFLWAAERGGIEKPMSTKLQPHCGWDPTVMCAVGASMVKKENTLLGFTMRVLSDMIIENTLHIASSHQTRLVCVELKHTHTHLSKTV